MANELDYGLKPLNQFATPAGAPEDWEPEQEDPVSQFRNFVMQQYLENYTKAMSPVAPPPVMSKKEQRGKRLGGMLYPYQLEEERTRPFQMAEMEKQQAIANLGALEPVIRAMMMQDVRGFTVTEEDPQGVPRNVRYTEDPRTGQIRGATPLGSRAYAPAFLASPQGYVRAERTGEPTGERVTVGGQPVLPSPPAGVTGDIAATTAGLSQLDRVWSRWKQLSSSIKQKGTSATGQVVGTYAGGTRVGGLIAPEYASYYTEMWNALSAYLKQETGVQRGWKEMQSYIPIMPQPFDPDDLAKQKIEALANRMLQDAQATIRAFPAAGAAAPEGGFKKPFDIRDLTDEELMKAISEQP